MAAFRGTFEFAEYVNPSTGGPPIQSGPPVVGTGSSTGSSDVLGNQISSITYDANGYITDYTENGIAITITYNANGTVNTVTSLGVTRTVTYNGDETVATYL